LDEEEGEGKQPLEKLDLQHPRLLKHQGKNKRKEKKGMQKMSVLMMMAVLVGGVLGSPQVALSA